MPVRKLSGYKKGADMPPHLRAMIGPKKPFSAIHPLLARLDRSAGAKTDHVLPNEPPVFDQEDIGSCVLNALVGMIACILAVEGLPFTMLSRLFLYWLCRLWDGAPDEDTGTYVHLAIERATNVGVPPESMWPYGDEFFLDADGKAVKPDPQCFPAASDNKLTGCFAIEDDDPAALDQMEVSVRANHPVQFGSDVDAAIQRYVKGDVLTAPDLSALIGGHSMLVTGVKFVGGKRLWWVRNSWAADYGDDGHLLADDAFMGQATDRWVGTRLDPQLL